LPPITLAEAGNYSVTVTNAFGSTNSGDIQLIIIVPAAGSFTAAVLANSPWGYWRLDDSAVAGELADQWGNNNGVVRDVSVPTYQSPSVAFIGFPNPHLGLQLNNDGTHACRADLPKLPNWTNQMTICFWVTNGAAQMCTMNGYGNGYGLFDNSGELIFEWASLGAPSGGGGLDTTLTIPNTGSTFVALVVEPTQATVYVGNNNGPLVSSTLTGLSLPTSDDAGDTAGLYAPGLGRMQWPYSEDGGGAPWNTQAATWSDVAIFFSSLSPSTVTNLYLTGVGQWLYAAPDGLGNLNMNWNTTFTLQQADSVTGPWTDVGGSPTPPYSVPIAPGMKFYRVRM